MKGLLDKRVVLVTGKGGVGRTTVSAALAVLARRAGKRVLVAEIGDGAVDYSALARHFGREHLPDNAAPIAEGILGSQLLPLTGMELFLASVLRVGALARAAMASEPLRRLLLAGPSFREMGLFYHLLTYLRARNLDGAPQHELIVLDMPATGHTLALTGLPEVLLRVITRGPIPDVMREGQSYLNDAAKAAALVVTLPETLPVTEALELLEGLAHTKVPVGGVILNRMPLDPFDERERTMVRGWLASESLFGADMFRRVQESQVAAERLRASVQAPVLTLPDLDIHGVPLMEKVADALGEVS